MLLLGSFKNQICITLNVVDWLCYTVIPELPIKQITITVGVGQDSAMTEII